MRISSQTACLIIETQLCKGDRIRVGLPQYVHTHCTHGHVDVYPQTIKACSRRIAAVGCWKSSYMPHLLRTRRNILIMRYPSFSSRCHSLSPPRTYLSQQQKPDLDSPIRLLPSVHSSCDSQGTPWPAVDILRYWYQAATEF